jgi:nitric oxide reductase NorQ protein
MPKQITKETTPDEIVQMADEYQKLLQKSGVAMKIEQTIADMEKRAADLNSLSVDDWKATFGAAPTAAAKAAKTATAAPKKPARAAVTAIDPDYFYVSELNKSKSTTWMRLRESGVVMNMLITGPSGCGKTELVKRLGQQFNKPVYKVDCASITTPDKWVGHKELIATDKGQETIYVKSMLLKWLAAEGFEPGIVLLDELNRLPAHLLNTAIPILDGSQSIWVPDLGIYSSVHPDTMIAATANQGVGYSGTFGLDIALHDRFGAVMEATFPPKEEEITVLMRRTGIEESKAQILVNIADSCRVQAKSGTLSKYVSTRGLIDCAMWAKAGMTIVEAAETTFVPKFSSEGGADSERAKVTVTVKGMAGNN